MANATWPEIPAAAWMRDMHASDESTQQPKLPDISDGGNLLGCPLGGFGTGGVGRDWQGSFRRWTLKPGNMKYFVEPGNGFTCRQRPEGGESACCALQPKYPKEAPELHPMKAWYSDKAEIRGSYHALFPKAWFHYQPTEKMPVEMICEQFSPVIPHNYREISYPVGVFRWVFRNTAEVPVEVSLMFSFVNMNHWFRDFVEGHPVVRSPGNFNRPLDGDGMKGVVMDHERTRSVPRENCGQFCIAVAEGEGYSVSRKSTWDLSQDALAVYEEFAAHGELTESEVDWTAATEYPGWYTGHVAGSVAVKATLAPGEVIEVPMTLVWDLPVVAFGCGREYFRRHTQFWGRNGDRAGEIAQEALANWRSWLEQIDAWHSEYISRRRYPDWYYRMLFNELYLLVDGYSVWTDKAVDEGEAEDFFGIIECVDYPFYNTLDLWVYGSFSVIVNWPALELNVIKHFADKVLTDDRTMLHQTFFGKIFPRTIAGVVPHDLGAPQEDPINRVNGYTYEDSTQWKDLNSQFIITVWRDYLANDDEALLRECYPAIEAAIETLDGFDHDGDGLIENGGFPDQTFDDIPMSGPSSYCAGLWLAALAAVAKIAAKLGDTERVAWCEDRLARGRKAFMDKLWTGTHFRIDTDSSYSDNVLAEQVFGLWYARVAGLGDLVDEDTCRQALETVFKECCMNIERGSVGVMNIAETSESCSFAAQIDEALVGINFSLANQMAEYGMTKEAEHVLKTMHDMIYGSREMWFRTPAAMTCNAPTFRAVINLRPLCLWGQEVVEKLLRK